MVAPPAISENPRMSGERQMCVFCVHLADKAAYVEETVIHPNGRAEADPHVFDAEYRTEEAARSDAVEWVARHLAHGPRTRVIQS